MNLAIAMGALEQYRQVDACASAVAEPHWLVQMLIDGALKRIAMARGCIARRELAQKCDHLGRAMAIIEALRLSLDRQQGAAIAQHLEDLYDYVGRRLLLANARNDVSVLDEVASLLGEIRDAWIAIAPRRPQSPAPRPPGH